MYTISRIDKAAAGTPMPSTIMQFATLGDAARYIVDMEEQEITTAFSVSDRDVLNRAVAAERDKRALAREEKE